LHATRKEHSKNCFLTQQMKIFAITVLGYKKNNNRKFKKESEQNINKLFHRLKNSLNLIENMNKKIKDLQNQSKLQCNETSPSILIQDFLRNVIILNL
ncbi:hypothetical protein A3Q56_08195, partial [Intoshia linei]